MGHMPMPGSGTVWKTVAGTPGMPAGVWESQLPPWGDSLAWLGLQQSPPGAKFPNPL